MTNNNLDNYVPENIRDVFVSKASASQNDDNLAGENESSWMLPPLKKRMKEKQLWIINLKTQKR